MRGALQLGSINRQITGIIPADAGSTSLMFFGRFGRRDHPRGCGEHGKGLKNGGISPGSSPRMRGARRRAQTRGDCRGIIPADAGSTMCPGSGRQQEQDHPRGCGEHPTGDWANLPYRGSSPRMRGAQRESKGRTMKDRIIPADAGST